MRLRLGQSAAALFVLCSTLHAPVGDAHHGGAVEWQGGEQGPLTGIATEFFFRFPHVVVELDVRDGDTVTHWAITTRWTPTILREHGWTRDSITPGDTVTVTYHPHVTEPNVAQMQTIEVNGEPLPLSFE